MRNIIFKWYTHLKPLNCFTHQTEKDLELCCFYGELCYLKSESMSVLIGGILQFCLLGFGNEAICKLVWLF